MNKSSSPNGQHPSYNTSQPSGYNPSIPQKYPHQDKFTKGDIVLFIVTGILAAIYIMLSVRFKVVAKQFAEDLAGYISEYEYDDGDYYYDDDFSEYFEDYFSNYDSYTDNSEL